MSLSDAFKGTMFEQLLNSNPDFIKVANQFSSLDQAKQYVLDALKSKDENSVKVLNTLTPYFDKLPQNYKDTFIQELQKECVNDTVLTESIKSIFGKN